MDNKQTNIAVESTEKTVSTSDTNTSVNTESHHHHSSHHHRHHSSHRHHHHSSHRHRHHSSRHRHSLFHKLFSAISSNKNKHSTSKIKSYAIFFLLLISVLVAFFPDGLIKRLISGKPVSGMKFEQIFTYFNPSGATNTNFGPLLLTAVCIILLAMSIIQLTKRRSLIIKRMIPIVSVIAVVIALIPLILGVGTLSISSIVITLLLAFVFWLSCKNPFERK